MTDIIPCPMCGRPVRVVGHPDFMGDPLPHTFHYEPMPTEREKALEAVAEAARQHCAEQLAACLDVGGCETDEDSPGCVNCYRLRKALSTLNMTNHPSRSTNGRGQ